MTFKCFIRHRFTWLITILFAVGAVSGQTISGTVTDSETSDPLPGVNIVIKGTNLGTTTDFDGNYSIEIRNGNEILVFSYTGFEKREISYTGTNIINVSLSPSTSLLDEVVVIGYGTQERKDVTGAISSVSARELEDLPVTTLEGALQGRAAGVQITQSGGTPGGAATVKIRGIATINNDEPLYVIDGIPVQTNSSDYREASSPLNSINPNDIKSIDILKDASAAAIYGARASAGVILITTKRGQAGKLRVNYQGYTGFTSNSNARLDNLMGKEQYLQYASAFLAQRDADAIAQGSTPAPRPTIFSEPVSSLPDVDYYDQIFKTGFTQNHNVSLSGGNETSTYLLSMDYFNQGGTVRSSGMERYTLRINSDHKVGKRIKIGESLNVSHFRRNRPGTGIFSQFGIVEMASIMSPLLTPYNPENLGGINQPSIAVYGHERDNPLIFTNLYDNKQNNYSILGNIYGQIELLPGLNFKSEVGVNFIYEDVRIYSPEYQLPQPGATRPSFLFNQRTQTVSPITINSLNYNGQFGNHTISATAAIEKVTNKFSLLNASGQNLPASDDANQITNVDPASVDAEGALSEWGLLSYLGRISYDYLDKYFVTGSLRRDGSSKLTGDNRYDLFPSFSLGWRVSNENFLKDSNIITDLKLRGGYGELGNVSSLADYQTQVPVQSAVTYVLGSGEQVVSGATIQRGANRDIQWELVTQSNFGVDIGLFQNKLTINADYFNKKTSRMIFNPPVPASSGFGSAASNIGNMSNKGFELAISHRNKIGDFQYNIAANITHIKNELTKLSFSDNVFIASGNTPDRFGDLDTSRSEIGKPIGQFFGYVYDGIHQEGDDFSSYPDAQPGDIRYRDINGPIVDGEQQVGPDGILDSNDRQIIGNPFPDFTYGINAGLSYKNLDLSLFIQGSQGNEIYNVQRQMAESPSDLFNKTSAVLRAWTPTQTNTDIPRYNVNDDNYIRIHSKYVEDGSYARLKNITLGYNLPKKITESLSLTRIRFYTTGQNLLTFTNYSGLDPEIGTESGSALALGIDNGRLSPVPKVFILGVQVEF